MNREVVDSRMVHGPRILYVCPQVPFPVNVGVRQRIFHIGRLLQRHGRVTLAMVGPLPPPEVRLEQTRQVFDQVEVFVADSEPGTDVRSKVGRLLAARNVANRDTSLSQTQQGRFARLADDHEMVWFHTLTTADATGLYSVARSVVDLDDLNSEKYALQSRVERRLSERLRLQWRAHLWRRWEKDALKRFSAVCVCSQQDREVLGAGARIHVVPNGFKPEVSGLARTNVSSRRLGFIGTIKYRPNLDGVMWFVQDILPRITQVMPEVRFRVIGECPPSGIPCRDSRLDVLGFLEDPGPEMATWWGSVVPLRFGGGTRLKILDAFSKLCPVVSTSVGAYGLEVQSGRHLLIADGPEEFARSCVRLLQDEPLRRHLAQEAWNLFQRHYTWDAIGKAVEGVVEACLANDLKGGPIRGGDGKGMSESGFRPPVSAA